MDLSTLVETSKAFEEHVVRGDDPLRAHGGVAIIRKNPYLSATQSLPMLTIVQVVHGCCKGSWSYGPITVLIWSPFAMFGFIWFTILNLSTAHPSLHRSLVIRRPK